MSTLEAYDQQVSQYPLELQLRECGLVALGRRHAEEFDSSGDTAAGSAVYRILVDLRKLAAQMVTATPQASRVDELRERRNRALH